MRPSTSVIGGESPCAGTDRAGVAAPGYWAQGCVFADYDGDARVDLLLTGFGRYLLFRNLGGLRFQDVTASEATRWKATG